MAEWVSERIGAYMWPPYTAIGVVDDDHRLIAGFVFNDFNGSNVELTAALTRHVPRGIVAGICSYVFHQMKCRRMTFRTRRSNARAMGFLLKHATVEALLPCYFVDDDAVQFRLLRKDCRWLKGNET